VVSDGGNGKNDRERARTPVDHFLSEGAAIGFRGGGRRVKQIGCRNLSKPVLQEWIEFLEARIGPFVGFNSTWIWFGHLVELRRKRLCLFEST